MGKHEPAAEPFYKAITSEDIRDYKTIKHGSKIHFQQEEGGEGGWGGDTYVSSSCIILLYKIHTSGQAKNHTHAHMAIT